MHKTYCNKVYETIEGDKLVSNSITLAHISEEKEVRADIKLNSTDIVVVNGILTDCNECPIIGQCVKLLGRKEYNGYEYYEVVAETVTDSHGRYTMEICKQDHIKYFVIAEGEPIKEVKYKKQQLDRMEVYPNQSSDKGTIKKTQIKVPYAIVPQGVCGPHKMVKISEYVKFSN